jgi:hypothetical protein
MEFKNLNECAVCNCIQDAKEDYQSNFALKTMKTELRIQDFNSYWDKGKRPISNQCEEICSLKGVSVSIFNDETKEAVLEIFKSLFPLAPKYKPFLSVVKLYDKSGLVKHTPNELNQYHFDFYKSDNFDFAKVELINVNELH